MRLVFFLLIMGCTGPDYESHGRPTPDPTPTPDPWTEIRTITNKFCSRCHEQAVFLGSEAEFLKPKVKNRIERRDMPPPSSDESRAMDQATRDRLLSYFGERP